MDNQRKRAVLIISYIVTFLSGCLLSYGFFTIKVILDSPGSGFYMRGSYSLPKTVMAEKISSDGLFKAVILKEDSSNAYYFAIERKNGSRLIVDEDFVPRAGYHHPVFTLTWNKTNDRVSVVVDHDFGDNNLHYFFDTNNLSWRQFVN